MYDVYDITHLIETQTCFKGMGQGRVWFLGELSTTIWETVEYIDVTKVCSTVSTKEY